MTNNPKQLSLMINGGIGLLVFALPLFFLPLTTNFYAFNKNFLLLFGVGILLVAWVIRMIAEKQVRFIYTPLDLPVLGLGVAFLASALLASPNKVESLLVPGGAGTMVALTILYFLVTNHLGERSRETGVGRELLQAPSSILPALTASAVVLAILAVGQYLGLGRVLAKAEWLQIRSFTPAGGLLPLGTFLGVIGVIGIIRAIREKGPQVTSPLIVKTVVTVLIIIGLGVTAYQLTTTDRPILLPQSTGWLVAMETFKNHPLLGVGPGQFLTAFTRYRPLVYNQTALWAFRFGASSNYLLNLLTETGVLGLGAFLFLGYKGYRGYKGDKGDKGNGGNRVIPIVVVFLLLALLPVNPLLLLLLYVLLADWAVSLSQTQRLKISLVALREGLVAVERTELGRYFREEQGGTEGLGGPEPEQARPKVKAEGKIEILPWLVFVPTVILVLGSFYFLSRVYAAEMDYKRALDAAAANRGKETYDLQIAAITKNPYFDYYRTSYSQVNLALANNLAANPELTDQDRGIITQLVQQAIREGKAAVALNPTKVTNWENLAVLYRALINFANDADQWAIAAFAQAVNLDPFNPGLRIDLGGVHYSLGNFEAAQRQFEIAANLKPDLANTHYNLAAALKERNQLELAQLELETTLSLLEIGSNDYERVKNELTDLKEGLKAREATPSAGLEQITPPGAAGEGIEPPLELGEEAGPEITPQPTPTEEPTPTITPEVSPTLGP